MKKNSSLYDDELDLIALFKIIWDGKIKILFFILISFLVGLGYNFQIPENYLNSLTINSAKNSELLKLEYVQKLLKSNQSIQSNQLYLDKFINELEDYKEFLLTIKNTKKIQENVKIKDQEIKLFQYAKLLEIDGPKKNKNNYTINFKWHDPEEARKILKDTLNLTSNNLKISINNELMKTLENEKKNALISDQVRLDYLKEQSSIAKELNIANNQVDNVNLSQSSVSLSINTTDIAYYLRGYKAIEKEIELIQKRKYKNLKFIEQEVNALNDLKINYVNYNIYLMKTKYLKNTKLIFIVSILSGLIAGVFFVLISNAFQLKKSN